MPPMMIGFRTREYFMRSTTALACAAANLTPCPACTAPVLQDGDLQVQ